MSHPAPSTAIRSTKRTRKSEVRGKSQRRSPHTQSIHILDDDSLLNVFYLYRPAILLCGDEGEISSSMGATGWQWWYKLTHVCRRWRNLVLGSASYLGVCLVCTYGTPVADMLAHSPPLPLIIDYFQVYWDIPTKVEEGMVVALEQHDRVRRLRLRMPEAHHNPQIIIMAMDGEYPKLEYLLINGLTETTVMLPEAFRAPHLRHVSLSYIDLPIGSRLLTTAAGLVTLALTVGHPSPCFQSNILLQWLSFMPQLEKLMIVIFPDGDVEAQLVHTPIMTNFTLPNLRCFEFQGSSTYMEAVICCVTTPRLEKLRMKFDQLTFSVPSLLHLSENFKFDTATLKFSRHQIEVRLYPRWTVKVYHPLSITVSYWHINQDASSVAQVFKSLSQMSQIFSSVEHLTLAREELFEEHDEVDRTEWHNLLRSFRNLKTFCVDDIFVQELSRSLRPDDGELPLELLPRLQELTYFSRGGDGDAFTLFTGARQKTGHPVTLIRF